MGVGGFPPSIILLILISHFSTISCNYQIWRIRTSIGPPPLSPNVGR